MNKEKCIKKVIELGSNNKTLDGSKIIDLALKCDVVSIRDGEVVLNEDTHCTITDNNVVYKFQVD